MFELIDRPIYTTNDISYINSWPTSYVRRHLKRRKIWTPEGLNPETKIESQIVASYRDFIFLDILHFLLQRRISPKKQINILKKLASSDQFFYNENRELELATDGIDFFGKLPNGENINLENDQMIFPLVLEPILEKRIFSKEANIFSWQLDQDFPDIIIHPAISFGKPHIKGRRLKTEFIYDIYKGSTVTVNDIAIDFEIDDIGLIKQAIDFEKKHEMQNRETRH